MYMYMYVHIYMRVYIYTYMCAYMSQGGLLAVNRFAPQVAWVQGPWWTYFAHRLQLAIYPVLW